jgi:hypothetical protein
MEMNELKCKFNILEAKEKLAPYNDNFCTRRENSKQDHPQPHFQQVEYSSIVGLMFDIHHFGFCSYGCLFFDADRLFRAVASPYFALDDAYTPHLLARLLCE